MDFLAGLRRCLRRRNRSRRGHRLAMGQDLAPLEDRRLMAVSSVTLTVTPKILTPNRGQGVNVVLSGTVEQVLTDNLPMTAQASPDWTDYVNDVNTNDAKPVPSEVVALVTDQYRELNPRVFGAVDPTVTSTRSFFRPTPRGSAAPPAVITIRDFHYEFPVKLQAKAASIGRRYDITIFASDFESGAQATAFAYVPFKPPPARLKSPK